MRRMLSNRESARRSRRRKQAHMQVSKAYCFAQTASHSWGAYCWSTAENAADSSAALLACCIAQTVPHSSAAYHWSAMLLRTPHTAQLHVIGRHHIRTHLIVAVHTASDHCHRHLPQAGSIPFKKASVICLAAAAHCSKGAYSVLNGIPHSFSLPV